MENSIYLKSIPLVFEDHGDKLLKALYDQQKKSQLCDVSLVVENVSFPAHKAVLAAHSTYFQALFDRGKLTDEAGSKACNVTTIHLSSISANTFIPILHFLYTSRLHVFCENVRDLMKSARKLQISAIVQACEHLTAENVALPSVSEIRHNQPHDLTSPINQQTHSVLYVDLKSEDDDDYHAASPERNFLELQTEVQDQTVSQQFLMDGNSETKVRGGRTQKKGFPKKLQLSSCISDSSVSQQLHSVQNISTIAPASIFGRTNVNPSNKSRLPLSPIYTAISSSENSSRVSAGHSLSTENLTFGNNLESLGNVFANESSALMLDGFHSIENSNSDLIDKSNSSLKPSTTIKTPDSLQVQSVYSMSPKFPCDQSTSTLTSSLKTKPQHPSKGFLANRTVGLSSNFPVDLHLTTAVTSLIATTTQQSTPSVYTCKDCCKYFTNVTEAVNHYYSEHPVSSTTKQVNSRQTPDRGSHSCPHCGRLFNNKNNLKRHILIKHTTDKRFKCTICGRRYAIRQSLQYHVRSIHGKDFDESKSSVRSPEISSTNDSGEQLIITPTDVSVAKIQSPMKSLCNEKLADIEDYAITTSNPSYILGNSLVGGIDKGDLLREHHPACSEDLPTIQSVESMQHISNKAVEVDEAEMFRSNARLVKAEPHGASSSTSQPKNSTAFPGLSNHKRNPESVMVSHTIPGIDQVDLSVESLAVSGGNPFVLSGTSQLPALLPVFSDYRRGTSNEMTLSQSRVGSRLHRCDTCGRAFSTIQAYTRHRRSCNKHECPICHRGFSQMGNMRRHIKIFHSDQKPYECKVCNKAYGIQQSFRYHMRDKHGITTIAKPVSKSKKSIVDTKK